MIKRNKTYLILLVLFLVSNLYFLNKWKTLEFELFYNNYGIPDIELQETMTFYDSISVGKIVGFVAFDNIKNQPKSLRQYYSIEAMDQFDELGNQLFSLQQIIKMDHLPPSFFEKEILLTISNTDEVLVLQDVTGNKFNIAKNLKSYWVEDVQGDSTHLITNQDKYREFIFKFLGYR